MASRLFGPASCAPAGSGTYRCEPAGPIVVVDRFARSCTSHNFRFHWCCCGNRPSGCYALRAELCRRAHPIPGCPGYLARSLGGCECTSSGGGTALVERRGAFCRYSGYFGGPGCGRGSPGFGGPAVGSVAGPPLPQRTAGEGAGHALGRSGPPGSGGWPGRSDFGHFSYCSRFHGYGSFGCFHRFGVFSCCCPASVTHPAGSGPPHPPARSRRCSC